MTGYTGEGKKEFKELYDFVEDIKFDRLGVFTYSEEENTYSATHFKDDITQKEKQERADKFTGSIHISRSTRPGRCDFELERANKM